MNTAQLKFTPSERKLSNFILGWALLLLALLAMVTVFVTLFSACSAIAATVAQPREIELTVGKSQVLATEREVSRISLAQPEFAEILLLSPQQLYLAGKKPGATNLTLWDKQDRMVGVYDLVIRPNVVQLKTLLHRIYPAETGIQVLPAADGVTLAGTVSGPQTLKGVADLAERFAPNSVVNLMSVGGVQQVQLEVKIAEMQRNDLKRMGINLDSMLTTTGLDGALGFGVFSLYHTLHSDPEVPATGFEFHYDGPKHDVGGLVDILHDKGLAKVLAEPTLVCLSGRSADFLAGGEIPVPIPQGFGMVAVEYKPFGVSLQFKPKVLGPNKISIEVAPEVSELDYRNVVEVSGYKIPGLRSRRASTVVELADGQSFAIAGLLEDSVREVVDKFPGLGDLPILGALFRSTEFQQNQTELIIMVTPRLVKPIQADKQPLPTDGFTPPSSTDFFLLGRMVGGENTETAVTASLEAQAQQAGVSDNHENGGMEGAFGHIQP